MKNKSTKKKSHKKKARQVNVQHTADPWEKQEQETLKAFTAFCIYRDMGRNRSLRKASDNFYSKPSSNHRQVALWSSNHHWVSRIEAWEIEQDRAKQETQKEALEKMVKRHADAAFKLQEKGLERLKQLDTETLSAKDTLSYITEAAKLERLTLGAPDHKIEHIGKIETTEHGFEHRIAEDEKTRDLIDELLTRLSTDEPGGIRIPCKSGEVDTGTTP